MSIDLLSKDEVIKEYGVSYSGSYIKVSEFFGEQPYVVCEGKYSIESIVKDSLDYNLSSVDKNIELGKKYLQDSEKTLWSKIFLFKKRKYVKNIISDLEEKRKVLLETKPEIVLLEDVMYELPQERLHTGEEVFVVDFFQKTLTPVFRVLKVKSTDITVTDNVISLCYNVKSENNDVDMTLKVCKSTGKLETNYSDCYVMRSRDEALDFVKSYIDKHCKFMKIAEQELIKQINDSK